MLGGGICSINGSLTLNRCNISNNQTQGRASDGGGIFSHGNDLSLDSCTITHNQTLGSNSRGGGIFSFTNSASLGSPNGSHNLTLNSCVVSNNQTQGASAQGGGIYSFNSIVTLHSCTVSQNQTLGSDAPGGGILSFTSDLTLDSCTIAQNQTHGLGAFGGGIAISNRPRLTSLTNCTVSGNSAHNSEGGGLSIFGGIVDLVHCTITNNTAPVDHGSGIASVDGLFARAILSACIVADNTNSDIDSTLGDLSPFRSLGDNLIGTSNSLEDFDQESDRVNLTDLLLSPLGNFGGLTQTISLLPGSSAIDMATSSPLITDQRGLPRLGNGQNDIGATECQAAFLDFQDNDNDNMDDRVEALFGFDPSVADAPEDPASRLRPIATEISGTALVVTFETLPGFQHSVERGSDLNFGDAAVPLIGTSGDFFRQATISPDSGSPLQYFGRIRLELPNSP